MPIKSELFSACLLLVTSITFIFVSLFPYFLIVGSAGQAVTLSPDLLRCAAKPVILHWPYHNSTDCQWSGQWWVSPEWGLPAGQLRILLDYLCRAREFDRSENQS
jgi:hypothetical protein